MSDFPYPGLRPFRRNETDIFFGREEQVDQLLDKLEKSRFLSVVGPSGCGKSSLVRAGMLAALETGFLSSAGVRWRIAIMHPGNCPMRNFAEALLDDSALGPERERQEDSVAFLLAALRRGPLGLVEALVETPLPQNTNLLILVDQFEEIFRYRQQYSLDEAEAFVALLLASAEQRGIPLYVVITLRSDFLSDCAHFSGLPEVMNESQFLTPCLTREQRSEAIVGPAGVFGGKINPNLVNQLLNDMGTDPDQLPLMQHALMRMWSIAGKKKGPPSLTIGDYEAIGGLQKALSNHADEAFEELDEEQKSVAEILFRCLSERSAARDIRRPARLSEAAIVAGVSPEKVMSAVEVFRRHDRSFLTPPAGIPLTPDTIIDISHESLIRQWKRLNYWVDEEADSAENYCHLEQTACLWKRGKAALWSTPDLENALAWKAQQHPTREWAKRYGQNFKLAMEFLSESKKRRVEEEKKKEDAHRRELKKTRKRLALALIGLIIALGLATWAILERGKAQRAEKLRTCTLFESYLTQASLLAKNENYQAASKTLNQSRELDKEMPAKRRHARNLIAWYTDLVGETAEKIYDAAEMPLLDVAVSPYGHYLAGCGEKGWLVLFDIESGELLKRWQGHTKDVHKVVFHPKINQLATGGCDKRIIFWDLPGGKKLWEWQAPDEVRSLSFSPDGSRLATGGKDHHVTIWDTETGNVVHSLKGHKDTAISHVFSLDARLLAGCSRDNKAIIWDLKTGQPLHILDGHTKDINVVAFHPDGKILATGGDNQDIRLWDVESGKLLNTLWGHKNAVCGLAFINSGRYLASAGRDFTVRIWDMELGITVNVLQGHKSGITGIAIMGDRIFSSSWDCTLRRWRIFSEGQTEGMKMVDLPGEPISCAIAPNCATFAVGFVDGGLRLYTLPDVNLVWEKGEAHTAEIRRIAFSPNGKSLASASLDQTAKLWRTIDGQLVRTFTGHKKGIYRIAFSLNGNSLATAGLDGHIGFFKLDQEEGLFHLAHDGTACSVAFDASGQRLLSAGDDGKIILWDIKTWPPLPVQNFPRSTVCVIWAAFTPDGSQIVSVGREGSVRIFNVKDSKESKKLFGHRDTVYHGVFSPDGGQVATVSTDSTVRMWDLETGDELIILHLPIESRLLIETATAGLSPCPLRNFDFRCGPQSPSGGECWIIVPLPRGKLALYNLGNIYD